MWPENKQNKLKAREKDCFWGGLRIRQYRLSVFDSSDSPTLTAHGIQPDCRVANALQGRSGGPQASMDPPAKCATDTMSAIFVMTKLLQAGGRPVWNLQSQPRMRCSGGLVSSGLMPPRLQRHGKNPGTVTGVFMNPNGATQFDGAIPEKSSGDLLLRKPTIELRVGNRDSSSDPRAGNRVGPR
jgi:hypothetical protein